VACTSIGPGDPFLDLKPPAPEMEKAKIDNKRKEPGPENPVTALWSMDISCSGPGPDQIEHLAPLIVPEGYQFMARVAGARKVVETLAGVNSE